MRLFILRKDNALCTNKIVDKPEIMIGTSYTLSTQSPIHRMAVNEAVTPVGAVSDEETVCS